MNFPTLISRMSPFPILGVLSFIFYSNSNRTFYEQTVETLVRRRRTRRLIWVWTVCLCPTKRTLGLYGLNAHSPKRIPTSIVHIHAVIQNVKWPSPRQVVSAKISLAQPHILVRAFAAPIHKVRQLKVQIKLSWVATLRIHFNAYTKRTKINWPY